MFKYLILFMFLLGCGDNLNPLIATGDSCKEDSDCPGGLCIKKWGSWEFKDGYCSQACPAGNNDCDGFEDDTEACISYDKQSVDDNICAERCTGDLDCKIHYWCWNISFNPQVSVCLPDDL